MPAKTGYPSNVVSETPEEEAVKKKSQKGNAAGGFLAMLPTIAGAIPGLMKSKQTGALRDMQQGRGAGAMAARQVGSEAGRRTAGNVGGRGGSGQIRSGLRSAEEMTSRGAQAAGLIGAREGMFATQALMGDEQRRRQLGLRLGAGIGGAMASGLATGLAGADQGPSEEVAGALVGSPGGVTGLNNPAAGIPASTQGAEGSVFGTPGRAFGEDPSLTPGPGTLQGPEQGGLQSPPDTQLQEPMSQVGQNQAGAPGLESGVVLPSLANPEQGIEAAVDTYRRNVTRKSDAPLISNSKGGSDDVARQEDQARNRARLEQYLAEEVAKFESTGGAYGMPPEMAQQQLLFFDTTNGQVSDASKQAMGDF